MLRQLKTLARAGAPGTPVQNAWGLLRSEMKRRQARIAFRRRRRPPFLPSGMLIALMRSDYRPPDAVRYDPDGLVLRAEEKLAQMQARLPLAQCRTCGTGLLGRDGPRRLARRGHVA
jgi:hypothetical protein